METTWLNAQDADFDAKLAALTAWSEERDEEVADRVRGILRDVAKRGDAALVEYTNRFDRRDVAGMDELVVGHEQLQAALARIPAEQRQALEAAAERVRRYHEKQKQARQHVRVLAESHPVCHLGGGEYPSTFWIDHFYAMTCKYRDQCFVG